MNAIPSLLHHDAPLPEVVRNLSRRHALGTLVGGAIAASPLASFAACTPIPSEVAGPFPGDGTNGPNGLVQTGIVRSDMRANFGLSGTATVSGVPLAMLLRLVNTDHGCALLSGYSIYLWHCDGMGNYSMYGSASRDYFLRAVQATDATGTVTFSTIVPGTYPGRWPHMHFEIYRIASGTFLDGRGAIRTSQLALPQEMCKAAYSALPQAYGSSAVHLANTSLARDGIFGDGVSAQMVDVSGNATTGFTATLTIGIAAGAGVGISPNGIAVGKAVEFYNTTLDHYVIVSDPNEAAAIEAGLAGPGWSRTGQTFSIPSATETTALPVYRFYGSVTPGPNSHFFTTSEEEKSHLIAVASATPATQKKWNYEGIGFRAGAASHEACPQSLVPPSYSIPVYRLYNNGYPARDSNHRYTSSTATVQEMQAKGWKLEGVAFCALAN
jgi:protocatechuate 3,4-dioxygenase beta subunit